MSGAGGLRSFLYARLAGQIRLFWSTRRRLDFRVKLNRADGHRQVAQRHINMVLVLLPDGVAPAHSAGIETGGGALVRKTRGAIGSDG